MEAAKTDMDAANLLKSNVQKEIEDIRKVSQAQIAKAEQERDAAIRERDDARTIAAEKTKNNELLKQQIEGMKIDFDQKLEIAILKAKVEKKISLMIFGQRVQKRSHSPLDCIFCICSSFCSLQGAF